MLNICEKCGAYRVDKTIDPGGPFAICPECGHAHSFAYSPLWVVSGASGSGKSTVCRHLTGKLQQVVLMDSDILWREAFNTPENNYADFFETWLRICMNIAQSGRPVVLFGAGAGVPENLENCIERRYFSTIHYLALVCADEVLTQRLQTRPAWRKANSASFIQEQLRFNQWFLHYNRDGLEPAIRLLDTSLLSLEETAQEITSWIDQKRIV
jgi:predicted kinase